MHLSETGRPIDETSVIHGIAAMDLGLSRGRNRTAGARARICARDRALRAQPPSTATSNTPGTSSRRWPRPAFCGMTIPKALGGQGRSFLDAVLVIEEMAKSCTVTARIVVETNMGAISTVMAYGSEAQKKLAARLVLEGDKPAICITEPEAGSDATGHDDPRRQTRRSYVINGKKHWITGAGVSQLHLIFARVFDERGQELGIGGFLAVRDEAKGLARDQARADHGPARHAGGRDHLRGSRSCRPPWRCCRHRASGAALPT